MDSLNLGGAGHHVLISHRQGSHSVIYAKASWGKANGKRLMRVCERFLNLPCSRRLAGHPNPHGHVEPKAGRSLHLSSPSAQG
jgi:hypothetical protein